MNDTVANYFNEAADELIEKEQGNAKTALCKTLALLSGYHKEVMSARSLLTGQEQQVTFQVTCNTPFYSISMVWNILRRFLPEAITGVVRGMRAFKDLSGACFDVPDHKASQLEDIFEHAKEQRNCDFAITRA